MGASDFEALAQELCPDHRVIALDQRGFGETDHTDRHSAKAYVSDVLALLDAAGIDGPVPILGHSFGGVVAYHFAAAHPDLVSHMIILDIGVRHDDHNTFVRDWAGVYPPREELEAKIGERLSPYLQKSIHRVKGGWSLNFDPDEYLLSETALNGDDMEIWCKSTCPALIIRGADSRISDADELAEMAQKRARTDLIAVKAGHSVHVDNPAETATAIRNFLANRAVEQL
jgi:pimeloyl-ACP methyl ester carboxylesterase